MKLKRLIIAIWLVATMNLAEARIPYGPMAGTGQYGCRAERSCCAMYVEESYDAGEGVLQNGHFDQGTTGWSYDLQWQGRPVTGGSSSNPCMEVFNAHFDVYQDLSGLQPGYYRLTVQAFQRTAANAEAWQAYTNGTAVGTAVIYGNDTGKPIHNIMAMAQPAPMSEGNCYTTPVNTYVPNDMLSASAAFTAGLYQNSLTMKVGDDGCLRIGIRSISGTGNARWTCCDNFVLTYLGIEKPDDDDQVDINEQLSQDYHELQGALAVRYMHQGCKLPTTCTYGSVRWNYIPSAGENAAVTFDGKEFTVVQRGNQPISVGTLQGIVTIEGTEYELFDSPLSVTIAPDDHAVGYLYCHMPDRVPETGTVTLVSQVISYALGTEADKGLVFHELNRGRSIIDGIGSTLPWCRDAFLAKDTQRHCYYIVTTDLYGSMNGGTSMLGNYSIGMFRSYDLINWTYSRCDLKQYLLQNPPADIYDNTGTKKLTASKVSRVWAPQIIFIGGVPYIYYAVGNTDNGDCDHFYISRANEDFTDITSFQLLYGPNKTDNILDADIVWLETDQRYHMSFRDYAAGTIRDITCDDLLNPEWDEASVSAFTDGSGFEASSVFRRINDDVWNVGNVNYGNRQGFHFHTADALLRNLQTASDLSGNLSPQHGSFVMINQTEWDVLQAWSDLRALIADATALSSTSDVLSQLIATAQADMTTDRGADTNLDELAATLMADREALRACYQQELTRSRASLLGVTDSDTPLDILVDELIASATEIPITNGNFSAGANGWNASPAIGTAYGVGEFFAYKTPDYTATISQRLTGLSEGDYLVTCQAFERSGANDGGRIHASTSEELHFSLFAASTATPVCSLYEIPYTGSNSLNGYADGMASASAVFDADVTNYRCAVRVHVEENGSLTFGLRHTTASVHTSDWCCFDNFHVYLLKDSTEVGVEEIVECNTSASRSFYGLDGIRRPQSARGFNIIREVHADGQIVMKKLFTY